MHDRDPLPTWTHGARGAARRRRPRHAAVPRARRLPGLEDAVASAEAVRAIRDRPGRALKQYEERRIARASRCQTVARPWGDLWHTQDPTLLALRNRVFRLRRPDDYTDLDWLYADAPTPRLAA